MFSNQVGTSLFGKVEKILKGSLDSIASHSPSVKIQIMGGKVCLKCKAQNIAGRYQKTFETKQCFALLPQVNSTANNNFH